jgi:hypothetical protein
MLFCCTFRNCFGDCEEQSSIFLGANNNSSSFINTWWRQHVLHRVSTPAHSRTQPNTTLRRDSIWRLVFRPRIDPKASRTEVENVTAASGCCSGRCRLPANVINIAVGLYVVGTGVSFPRSVCTLRSGRGHFTTPGQFRDCVCPSRTQLRADSSRQMRFERHVAQGIAYKMLGRNLNERPLGKYVPGFN